MGERRRRLAAGKLSPQDVLRAPGPDELLTQAREHCRGGTGFWRHRATGWEERPSKEQLAESGYATFLEFERRSVPTDRVRNFAEMQAGRDAAWDGVLHVPMRFNRLVVYRGDFFHAISELFGDRPENSRLVQLFYCEGTGACSK